jgi:type II secretory pathway component GspD/PulD (secretin)
VAVLACLGATAVPAQDPTGKAPAPGASGQKIKRVVYDVKHGVARDLADLLGKLFKDDANVQALATPTGNAVALSAPADVVDEVLKLLLRLDRQPRTVAVEVLIAEVQPPKAEGGKAPPPAKELDERELTGSAEDTVAKLQNMQKKGLLRELKRFRLSAAENHTDSVKVGGSKPYVVSIMVRNGVASRAIAYREVGTTVKATPQIGEDGRIVVELSLKDSEMRVPEDAPVLGMDENGQPVHATVFSNDAFEGKVTVRSGKIAVAQGIGVQAKAGRRQTLILVTARVVEPGAKSGKQ